MHILLDDFEALTPSHHQPNARGQALMLYFYNHQQSVRINLRQAELISINDDSVRLICAPPELKLGGYLLICICKRHVQIYHLRMNIQTQCLESRIILNHEAEYELAAATITHEDVVNEQFELGYLLLGQSDREVHNMCLRLHCAEVQHVADRQLHIECSVDLSPVH